MSRLLLITAFSALVGCGLWFTSTEKKNSIFETYADNFCLIRGSNNYTDRVKCSKLKSHLTNKSSYCSKGSQLTAKFPGQEKEMKLCQQTLFADKKSSSNLRFIILGDTGKGESEKKGYGQKRVAAGIQAICSQFENGCDFALLVGDVIYPEGIKSVWDSRAKVFFDDVYSIISPPMPFYIVSGNHDYHGNINAAIERTYFNDVWRQPHHHYGIQGLPNWISIYGLDTTAISKGKTTSIQLDAAANHLCNAEGWKFVFGHHPPDSTGTHGPSGETSEFMNQLNDRCKIDGIFAGHEHHLEHLKHNGYDVFVQGGGGTTVRDVGHDDNQDRQKFAASQHGFALVEASQDSVLVSYYTPDTWIYENGKFKKPVLIKDKAYMCSYSKTGDQGCASTEISH